MSQEHRECGGDGRKGGWKGRPRALQAGQEFGLHYNWMRSDGVCCCFLLFLFTFYI